MAENAFFRTTSCSVSSMTLSSVFRERSPPTFPSVKMAWARTSGSFRISAATRALLDDTFQTRPLGPVTLKCKTEPGAAYALLCTDPAGQGRQEADMGAVA